MKRLSRNCGTKPATILVATKIIVCKIFARIDDMVLRAEGPYFSIALSKGTFHVKHLEEIWEKYFRFLIKKAALEKQHR